MITNFHTHTTFCDGKSTAEEVVRAAIDKGFSALGFSGHGYTAFDPGYCMHDYDGYIAEVKRLQKAYQEKLDLYLGIEEDALSLVDRRQFDYLIGSSHYLLIDGKYYSVDSSREASKTCLECFGGDAAAMAEAYYRAFCSYIAVRKPDIIGHFDLITKFDEMDEPIFLGNPDYEAVAEKYITEAAKSGCIFEVNTGAISRGKRTTPYPSEKLMYRLKKLDARLILSSDSHHAQTLDCAFDETKAQLREIGFRKLMTLTRDGFAEYAI